MKRVLLALALTALFAVSVHCEDGIYTGATTERLWNFVEDRWVIGTTPFASLRWRGVDVTASTTYDRDGLFSTAFSSSYSRRLAGPWTLAASYGTYTFRGLPWRDHVWSVSAEAPVWKW
jgi:hypothetical protein